MTRRIVSPVLVGRTDELRQLECGLERAGSGSLTTFLVAGEAGVGKSRLVEEFLRRGRRSGARVLVGECMDAGEGALDHVALLQVLGQAAAIAPGSVVARMPDAKRAELAMLVPDLGSDLVVPPKGGDQTRLFDAVLDLLTRLARGTPVVLVIEDLHWSDRSTRELVSFVVRRVQDVGMVVVATYRDDELGPDHPLRPLLAALERLQNVERLDLARLGPDEAQRLVESIVGGQPGAELLTELIARSDGNPFFVEELLAAGPEAGELPRHLADLLLLRVDATSSGTRLAVRAAAVGGQRVDARLLEAVVGGDPGVLTESLRGAVAHHILVPSARGYAFRHALVREAVEGALLPGERQRLHLAWAAAYERDVVEHPAVRNAAARAYHWSAADRPSRALPAFFEAAVEAEAVRAYAAAAEHYERVLALWDREVPATADLPVERVDVAERGVDAAQAAGDHARGSVLARQALAHLGPGVDAVRAGLLHARLGLHLRGLGDVAGAHEAFEQALRSVPTDPPSPERASVLGDFAEALMLSGDRGRAEVVGEEALEVARAVGAVGTEAQALTLLAKLSDLRDLEGSTAGHWEALRVAEEVGDPRHRCRAYVSLAFVQWLAGDLAASRSTAERGLEVAVEAGLEGSWGSWLRTNAAAGHLSLGDWQAAARLTDETTRLGPTGVPAAQNVIGRARLAILAGRLDEAQQLLGSMAESTAEALLQPDYFEVCAELAMWQRRPETARNVLDQAVELLDENEQAWLPPVLAWATAAVADAAGSGPDDPSIGLFHDRVASRLEPETALPPVQRPWVRVAHAELARLRKTPTPALWDRAEKAWDALSIPYLAAYCRFRQAEAILVTDGSRSQAKQLLRAAHQTSSRLGAQPLREEIEALARRGRIDLQPRPAPEEGAGTPLPHERLGLTPREWDILQHVAQGTRNAQIATTLFISEKTVERHVTSILSKLGATNRVEAAGIVHRLPAIEHEWRNGNTPDP
jgi:DNA-binding CsgD family transcriptional regulator/tetratricopeptide (TPR) repeat protein